MSWQHNKRSTLALIAAAGAAMCLSAATPAAADAPKSIKIGYGISLTGPYAPGAGATTLGNYQLWVKDVNAKGGIYLSKYKKRVPVEVKVYDNKSSLEEAVRNTERLMLSDKVDFVLAPWGTATHLAVAPLYERHGYPLLAYTSATDKALVLRNRFKNAFWLLDPPTHLVGGLLAVLDKLKKAGKINNKVAIAFVSDQLGVEMASAARRLLPKHGFKVVYYKGYPLGVKDLSTQINEMKKLGVDTFLGMSYPPDTVMLIEQSKVLGFNTKVYFTAVGLPFEFMEKKFGKKTLQGIMGMGGMDPNYPPTKAYFERYKKVIGRGADLNGGPMEYASLQILQQAIEKVGEIDRKKVIDAITKGTFDTIVGKIKFDNRLIAHAWLTGQYQNGHWVGLEPATKRGAKPPIFPKPKWE
jgi:branched-chain amino acid transport system substrate-binding protein